MTLQKIYTLKDRDGSAVYVGCTGQLDRRLSSHTNKPWWAEVAAIEIDVRATREEALAREAELIRQLRPAHNIAHNREEIMPLFLAGMTLAEIGDRIGFTRQRAEKLLRQEGPEWLIQLEKSRRKARTRTRNALKSHGRSAAKAVLCRVCGDPVLRKGSTCGVRCADMVRDLSNHLTARARVADLKGKGRWFTEGSIAHRAATEAYERGLPIFDELPDDMQRQIRGEPRSWELRPDWWSNGRAKVDPHPCEHCGSTTRNPRFCGQACYYASGSIGKRAAA